MKIVKIVLLLVGVFILFQIFRSVIASALDSEIYRLVGPKIVVQTLPDNQEDCLAQGGDWARAGTYPKEVCRMPAKDAGKFCLAGFQCQYGSCLAKLDLRNPAIFATGICARYTSTFGCSMQLHFGFASQGICRD